MTNTLTFTDWENYTDDDGNAFTLDWTSPSAMQGRFAYPYLDAIRQASNERTITYECLPQLPVASPWASTWGNELLERVLSIITGWDGSYVPSLRTGFWVKPSLLPTIHNFKWVAYDDFYTQALADAAYTFTGAFTSWRDEALQRLIDDSGVTDVDFLAFIWAWSPSNILGLARYPYVPMSSLLWNIKKMISLLDTYFLPELVRGTSDSSAYAPYGTDKLKYTTGTTEGREGSYSPTTWAAAAALFDAIPWTTKGEGKLDYHVDIDGYTISIERFRREDTFIFPTMANAHIEIAQVLGEVGDYYHFDPTGDFVGLTDYLWPNDTWGIVTAVETTVDTSGGSYPVMFGDKGNAWKHDVNHFGWGVGRYAFRFDFSGSYFGGSGFIFHN